MSYTSASKTQDNERGVHTQVAFSWHVTNIMSDIQKASLNKHIYPQHYINSVENLYDVCYVYLVNESEFYQDIKNFNQVLQHKLDSLIYNQKQTYLLNVLPVQQAGYLYKAILCSLKRMSMLPQRRERMTI